MSLPLLSVVIQHEQDIVTARRRARQVAELLRFDTQDGTRIGTAVSEIARNAFTYGGGGKVEFFIEQEHPRSLAIRIHDRGPGIANVKALLAGEPRSAGSGIVGARRLMDAFEMESTPGHGTTVWLRKHLPSAAPALTDKSLTDLTERLADRPQDFYEEVRQQNQELLITLDQLRDRQEQLDRLNRELQETNRGVVALYGELEQKADQLLQAGQTKSRFLSHMSHEFRTPLNAITGLTRLLLKRPEIAASEEATREINYIQRSAESLTEMVNDLLDLAKAESGKLEVHAAQFDVQNLLGTLRGMFRPFFDETVHLVFEDVEWIPPMITDEEKVAQILRNFLSNALKYTEQGEVRVSARYLPFREVVCFAVSDTGVGIAETNHHRIFEEFTQIENPLQRRAKGTGLGLPLCKKLAELLGGSVDLESQIGVGSKFQVVIPRVYGRAAGADSGVSKRTLLMIDDEEISRYLLRQLLNGQHELSEASSGQEGLEQIRKTKPDAIFLDLNMPGMTGFDVLAELQSDPALRDIPVFIITQQRLHENVPHGQLRHAAAFFCKETLARAEGLTVDFGPPLSVSVRYNHEVKIEYCAAADSQCG